MNLRDRITALEWLPLVLLWFWPVTLALLGIGAFAYITLFAWRLYEVCGLCGAYGWS